LSTVSLCTRRYKDGLLQFGPSNTAESDDEEDYDREEDEDEALVSPMTKSEHQEEDFIEEEK
jgi:hypothetical protein